MKCIFLVVWFWLDRFSYATENFVLVSIIHQELYLCKGVTVCGLL